MFWKFLLSETGSTKSLHFALLLIWSFLRKQLTAEAVNYFRKKCHIRWFTGFWIRLCSLTKIWRRLVESILDIVISRSPSPSIMSREVDYESFLSVLILTFYRCYGQRMMNSRILPVTDTLCRLTYLICILHKFKAYCIFNLHI